MNLASYVSQALQHRTRGKASRGQEEDEAAPQLKYSQFSRFIHDLLPSSLKHWQILHSSRTSTPGRSRAPASLSAAVSSAAGPRSHQGWKEPVGDAEPGAPACEMLQCHLQTAAQQPQPGDSVQIGGEKETKPKAHPNIAHCRGKAQPEARKTSAVGAAGTKRHSSKPAPAATDLSAGGKEQRPNLCAALGRVKLLAPC